MKNLTLSAFGLSNGDASHSYLLIASGALDNGRLLAEGYLATPYRRPRALEFTNATGSMDAATLEQDIHDWIDRKLGVDSLNRKLQWPDWPQNLGKRWPLEVQSAFALFDSLHERYLENIEEVTPFVELKWRIQEWRSARQSGQHSLSR